MKNCQLPRAASKSNLIYPGDHGESPLQALVGAGLRVCVPARKCHILGDFGTSLVNYQLSINLYRRTYE